MKKAAQRLFDIFLTGVEKVGNALPNPATLFAIFSLVIIVLSWIFSLIGVAVQHPATEEAIEPVNLLSIEGLHRILLEMVTNFTGFAPLGTVFVAMLGIGIAESSGLIGSSLKMLVLSSPRKLLTFVVVFAGIMSNTASEVGYVLLVPLGGILFHAVGRHPIAGLAAAFAGVSGGYSANLLLGTIDPLLAGLSEEAARIVDPSYTVNAAANYYFMLASTPFIALIGTWVTDRIVERRLGPYTGNAQLESDPMKPLTADEKKGLRFALVALLLMIAVIVIGLIPDGGFLREAETGSIMRGPFLQGIVAFIFIGAVVLGVAYGWGAKTIRSDHDVVRGMGKTIETLGLYTVLVFFAAQFVAYFKWSNLGIILAVEGSDLLKASGLGEIPLFLGFILLTAVINLAMGSASAKWAIMAPVFIPMFMLLGYSPELVQNAYRIGDSVSNIISPMMSYFALIIAFFNKYDSKAGIGTLVATMLPYTVFFLIGWVLLFVAWLLLNLPVGPGSPMYYGG